MCSGVALISSIQDPWCLVALLPCYPLLTSDHVVHHVHLHVGHHNIISTLFGRDPKVSPTDGPSVELTRVGASASKNIAQHSYLVGCNAFLDILLPKQ